MTEINIGQEPPLAGTEVEALIGSLDRMRGYLLWKCGGLDAAGIRATLGPSTHHPRRPAQAPRGRSRRSPSRWKLHGRRPFAPFDTADWDDQGWHWRVEDDDTPESLEALFTESVAQGQALVDEAIADGGLGGLTPRRPTTRASTPTCAGWSST